MSQYTIQEKQLLDDFLAMVNINSPSKNEREVADWLIKEFEGLGCVVEEDDAGEKTGGNAGNLKVFLAGNTEGVDALLFSAHMDTVQPTEELEPIIEDGIVRSNGKTVLGADDKAGIAAILHLARLAQAHPDVPRGDLEFSIHISEEIGLLGAKAIDTSSYKAKMGFILDDHDPRVITIKSPSAVRVDYTIYGKAAHAGVEPEKGVSALEVAAKAISNMKLGRIDDETTANIGVINGGRATNIVMDKLDMKAEARSHDPQKLEDEVAHIEKCFEDAIAERKLDDEDLPRLEVNRKDDYKAVQMSEDDYPVRLVLAAGKKLGWDIKTQASGGGTDGSILSHKGIPCLVVGVGMQDVHTEKEWLKISDLEDAARLVASIVTTHAQKEV